jgi:soluble cytochrome b562
MNDKPTKRTRTLTPKQAKLQKAVEKALTYAPTFTIEFREGFIASLDQADLLAAEMELNAIQAATDALAEYAAAMSEDDDA